MYPFLKLLIAATVSLPLSMYSANAQTAIGTAVAVDDQVKGSNSGKLSTSSTIYANERITANSTGLAHFKFSDGTKMVVGPGTNLVLDQMIYNPDGSTFSRFVLKTSAGAARFISGSSNSSAYEIQTPVGTLGIRGTAFDLTNRRGRTYIMLVNGEVIFCGNSGQCQSIKRKCDYVVVNTSGEVNDPSQPRNGDFGSTDMSNFFPFINDQSQIEEDFRLRVNTCKGGTRSGGGTGRDDSGFTPPVNRGSTSD